MFSLKTSDYLSLSDTWWMMPLNTHYFFCLSGPSDEGWHGQHHGQLLCPFWSDKPYLWWESFIVFVLFVCFFQTEGSQKFQHIFTPVAIAKNHLTIRLCCLIFSILNLLRGQQNGTFQIRPTMTFSAPLGMCINTNINFATVLHHNGFEIMQSRL